MKQVSFGWTTNSVSVLHFETQCHVSGIRSLGWRTVLSQNWTALAVDEPKLFLAPISLSNWRIHCLLMPQSFGTDRETQFLSGCIPRIHSFFCKTKRRIHSWITESYRRKLAKFDEFGVAGMWTSDRRRNYEPVHGTQCENLATECDPFSSSATFNGPNHLY